MNVYVLNNLKYIQYKKYKKKLAHFLAECAIILHFHLSIGDMLKFNSQADFLI